MSLDVVLYGLQAQECRFVLQYIQCLLQTLNLLLATTLALLIRLRLGNAPLLDAAVVVQDPIQLRLLAVPVGLQLLQSLLSLLQLFGLVLQGSLLLRLRHLVGLRLLVILSLRRLLVGLDFRQQLAEIRLSNLQQPDDAARGTTGRRMSTHLRLLQECLSVVVLQHLNCHLNTLDALLVIGLRGLVILVLLLAVAIHLLLGSSNLTQLRLQGGDIVGQRGDGRVGLVDLALQTVEILLMLRLLLLSLSHLLIAEGLLSTLLLGLLQKLRDHPLDQFLDLGKHVLARVGSDGAGRLRSQQTDLHAVLLTSKHAQHLHH
mmetsp:Transcript_41149/g.92949  ORF Transcript_41149/g.92949 Transcript_41149/m.92949 type:complete len:317 (-) Transcript_41149:573-1523(-)